MRVGVVLLLPEPVAAEVDGLRRAFADPALDRVAPHITLVPPVNVSVEAYGAALAGLRRAAAAGAPLRLRLGPVVAFPTDEHVAYLAVGGEEAALARLRAALLVAPLQREVDHAFVPHVTLTAAVGADQLDRVVAAAAGYADRDVVIDRVHLLEERHTEDGRRWVPVADVALGPPAVVGRGGLPWELTTGELIDPEARGWLRAAGAEAEAGPAGTRPLVTVARREEAVAGVAWGWTAGPVAECVAWCVGVGDDDTAGHLQAAWWAAAAQRGAAPR